MDVLHGVFYFEFNRSLMDSTFRINRHHARRWKTWAKKVKKSLSRAYGRQHLLWVAASNHMFSSNAVKESPKRDFHLPARESYLTLFVQLYATFSRYHHTNLIAGTWRLWQRLDNRNVVTASSGQRVKWQRGLSFPVSQGDSKNVFIFVIKLERRCSFLCTQ